MHRFLVRHRRVLGQNESESDRPGAGKPVPVYDIVRQRDAVTNSSWVIINNRYSLKRCPLRTRERCSYSVRNIRILTDFFRKSHGTGPYIADPFIAK